MEFTNIEISKLLSKYKLKNDFYYIFYDNEYKLSFKVNEKTYCIINSNLNIDNPKEIIPCYSLSELKGVIKSYTKFFRIYYDDEKVSWVLDKSIFKLFFLDRKRILHIDEFNQIIKNIYTSETDLTGMLIYFLIKTNFIPLN
jgi:hypothetical protein